MASRVGIGATLLIFGVSFVVVSLLVRPVFMPALIRSQVRKMIADRIVIPNDTSSVRYKAFQGTAGQPPRYQRYYVYNITNRDAILAGDAPEVTILGPYSYRVDIDRVNVEFNKDKTEVSFEEVQAYHFDASQSVGREEDDLLNLNVVYQGATYLINYTQILSGTGVVPDALTKGYCDGKGDTDNTTTCFFRRATVHAHIWGRYEHDIEVLAPYADSTFKFFFNCSSAEECRRFKASRHFFGTGGSCVQDKHPLPLPGKTLTLCMDPASANSSIRNVVQTGAGSADARDVNQYLRWQNNETLSFQFVPQSLVPLPSAAEPVTGTDGSTFHPLMSKDDVISVFDAHAMRSVPLRFDQEVKFLGLTAWRFRPAPEALPDQGTLDLTPTAAIRYGSPSPVVGSRIQFFKSDHPLSKVARCTNCAGVFDDLDSFVDVEPYTGVSMRGRLRVQLNVHTGQSDLFGRPNDTFCQQSPDECEHMHVQETFVPYVIVEQEATMNSSQAHDLFHDLYLAQDVGTGLFWGLLVLGIVLVGGGAFMLLTAYQRPKIKYHELPVPVATPRTPYGAMDPKN